MAIVLILYPIGVVRAAMSHKLFPAIWVHLSLLTVYGVYYRIRVRHWPVRERVSLFSYIPHALVMPITSGLLVVLALFTLDSGSWETRGHVGAVTRTPRT
jgi:N-acetylglucosaminyltransferase